ncbi:hypothetical protein SAMN04488564_111123 [Lentzea waywayandensis]|uniref:Uncharacterized protein n=1 Tax=Lentzea waywayandensis TaxID=84724 RepID=A0A1I6FCF5_9PSEU|nr:hypothetical protein [Lentzea waywayandensis]SFR27590.1 hypothetical protein SAMN04488564_111123 [Lentzea waywayandensis]
MTRKSPQEKKALSYAKDHRNSYGENDKSSRKNIQRNKRNRERANRRRDHQVLVAAQPDDIESEIKRRRPKGSWWRKWSDSPLAEIVARKLRRRARTGIIEDEQAEAKIAKLPRVRRR